MRIQNPDEFLLERIFQPLSNRIEYYSGINCFTLALIAWTIVSIVRLIIVEVAGAATLGTSASNALAWGIGVGLLIGLGRMILSAPGTMNPFRHVWWGRIFVLAAVLYRVAAHAPVFVDIPLVILLVLVIALTMISAYFASCDPMPPGWKPPARLRFAPARN